MVERILRRRSFGMSPIDGWNSIVGYSCFSHGFSYLSRGEVMYYFRTERAHSGLMARSLGTSTYCIAALSLLHFPLH